MEWMVGVLEGKDYLYRNALLAQFEFDMHLSQFSISAIMRRYNEFLALIRRKGTNCIVGNVCMFGGGTF